MKKILFVFGTRPEAIKMAPLIKEFEKNPRKFKVIVCVTAQHRELLDQVLKVFEIVPDYDLNIMTNNQDLFDITSTILIGMRGILSTIKPDYLLVHGDTSTSTAAALAGFYLNVPVAHIEAGLRTHNVFSPWPEELNRQLTARIASYHFAPTQLSKANLELEGISSDKIIVTGNTVIDALFISLKKINSSEMLSRSVVNGLVQSGLPEDNISNWFDSSFTKRSLSTQDVCLGYENPRKLVLITGHRRENFGTGFINICKAIRRLALEHKNVDFVYPMHLNPNVRNSINEVFFNINDTSSIDIKGESNNNTYFIEPLEYFSFIYLMNCSYVILTDSGGVQEEAPALGKPVVVMRDNTERPEALDAGTVILAGTNEDSIFNTVNKLLIDRSFYAKMSNSINPYGDGLASERIVSYFSEL